jgi:predicted RNA-binding protein with RPS1 domain
VKAEADVLRPLQFGEIVDVVVTGMAGYGAFVCTEEGHRGLIHLSELTDEWVPFGQVGAYLSEGDRLKVRVIKANPDGYGFSAKGVTPLRRRARTSPTEEAASHDARLAMEGWLRYLREVCRHLFASPQAQDKLRALAEEAGPFALGVAMGNRLTVAALEAWILRDLRAALGLRQVEPTEHAVERWIEKVDPAATREEARLAIQRAARAGVEVREPTSLVQAGNVILAITWRGAVATVYLRDEGPSPALPEESFRVNGLPLGTIARVRASEEEAVRPLGPLAGGGP